MKSGVERKYFYARTVGNPQSVLGDIINIVQDADLASEIPLVKLEKNPRREFYVFLGVESSEGPRIPSGLGAVFAARNIYFEEDYPLRPEEIRPMVQRQDIEIHGFQALQYRRQLAQDPGDPFDESDSWQPNEPTSEERERYDRLLQWLSARGEGTWAAFAQACEMLEVTEDRGTARSAIRRLSLLGHMDCSADGSRWSISPSALVRFPDNKEDGFISGQRTSTLIHNLGALAPMSKTIQSHFAGPTRFSWDNGPAFSSDSLANLGVEDGGVTAERLAELLPELHEWKDSLQPLPGLSTTSYRIEKWQGDKFLPCDTVRERNGVYEAETGMYRLSRDGDKTSRTLTVFFDLPARQWLRGDWYGLRFLALEAGRSGAIAVHDSSYGKLFIPESQRWPLLYERALTLASGLLPHRTKKPGWLSYSRIPLGLAQMLSRKLNVDLMEK